MFVSGLFAAFTSAVRRMDVGSGQGSLLGEWGNKRALVSYREKHRADEEPGVNTRAVLH